MDNLVIKNISEETLLTYKECFDKNESPKDIKIIDWQFLKNPINKKFVSISLDLKLNKTAAIYAVFPVRFKINELSYIATQSLDTITDVDYRGKGLFIKLAKDVYQKAKDDSVVLVYGFPNGNSIHGFKTKLGWEVLDPIPFIIKPLRSSYFTNKISFLKWMPNINLSFIKYKPNNNYIIKEEKSFSTAVDLIWSKFSKEINVALIRDKKYLDWRYIEKPNEEYKIVHCKDKNNNYLGYVVFTIKNKHNGKIAYIMELIYDLETPEVGIELLKYAVHSIKKQKADCILAWNFEHSPNNNCFNKLFFVKMPEKMRPIELHFGVSSFKNSMSKTIYERKNWYLSYSDSDTV